MRSFLSVTLFELRHQLRSPFFLAALPFFALVHLLTATRTGVNLTVSNQADLNSVYVIMGVELLLSVFGMLPIIAFVASAMTRDHEHSTASLIFTTPVKRTPFLLGRFSGALAAALLIGVAGLGGSLLGAFVPWVDPARLAPFSLQPYLWSFVLIVLPNTIVITALFFSIAALTRSVALTYAAAMIVFIADLMLNTQVSVSDASWLALADPMGGLAFAAETRYWSLAELNTQVPIGQLPANRFVWLAIAGTVLAFTLKRFPLALSEPSRLTWKLRRRGGRTSTEGSHHKPDSIMPALDFSWRGSAAQLATQLRMDLSSVLKSPLFYIILVLGITTTVGEYQRNVSPLSNTPLYPLTSLMLDPLRILFQFVLLIGIYYSAELVHRERESAVDGIVSASPFPDWLMILSKVLSLCLVVTMVMLAVILTSIAIQASVGHTDFQIGLYLQSAFIYNGVHYFMLCILAVVIQTAVTNKWLGMLMVLSAYVLLLSLVGMGFEHPLYGFRIPAVIHSDMNGYGHFRAPVYSLMAYWGAFCVLLVVAGHLLYPRGVHTAIGERLADARSRIGRGVTGTSLAVTLVFIAAGSWIFYNTNILNDYVSADEQLQRRADYERQYGHWDTAPTPSFDHIDMAVDLFPEERRLESRGEAVLGNHKEAAISEFVISVDPKLRVNRLDIETATLTEWDWQQGFYRFTLESALAPEEQLVMHWDVTRSNPGFVTRDHDHALAANGTFIDNVGVMPIPGYDHTRHITDNDQRRQYGLEPARRIPPLGDPDYLDNLRYGVDARSEHEIVISTAADQIAVAPGAFQEEWEQHGRRYFRYASERPVWPAFSFSSARYAVARDRWRDVSIEIYHHPEHGANIDAMIDTTKRALAFFTQQYGPYQHDHFRILEYPRYRSGAQAFPGTVPYSEALFVADLSDWEGSDYVAIHELAHNWWGGKAYGARMQGQQMLNETMAQYATLRFFEEHHRPELARRIRRDMLLGYLQARSEEYAAEQPVMYTEAQGYISYNKGPLALYALQQAIGEERVNQALRNYLDEFAFQPHPFPTSRDLVDAFREQASPEHQDLITDLFEKIVFYDVSIDNATARQLDDGYEVTLEVTAGKFEVDGVGNQTEVPFDAEFDVALFANPDGLQENSEPLHLEKHRLHSGSQVLTIRTERLSRSATLDPYYRLIERTPENNQESVVLD